MSGDADDRPVADHAIAVREANAHFARAADYLRRAERNLWWTVILLGLAIVLTLVRVIVA